MTERMADLFSQLLLSGVGICLVYVLMKIIQLYYKRQALLKVFKNFPGPRSHWLYGNVHQITSYSEELTMMRGWAEKFPYAYPRWFGGYIPILVITHPDYAKTVFGRGDPKAKITYQCLIPWIGEGLLVLNGPKWHQHRRLLTPAFHFDILKPYVAQIADSTKVMLDKWEKLIAKDPTTSLEMFDHVSLMTLDSIMKSAFSYKSNCQTDRELVYYVKAVSDLTLLVFQRATSAFLQNDLYYLCPSGWRFKEACKLAHQHTVKVIEERKKSLQNEQELEKIQKKRHLDFLDILLCAKDENGVGLSDEDLRAEVDTFMFEGHDTTASGISWSLFCMAQHPEHQQRCREEIKDILGDRENIQWDDLGKMTYTTMCIKESFRLYPPVPLVSRQLSKPITFFDGRTLPEGSYETAQRQASIWKSHRGTYGAQAIGYLFCARPIEMMKKCTKAQCPNISSTCLEDSILIHVNDLIQFSAVFTPSLDGDDTELDICAEKDQFCSNVLAESQGPGMAEFYCIMIGINIDCIHKNPTIWQDPEVYDPARFSAENKSRRHPHAFIPFAAGSRNCIGQLFAMNEVKIALALTLLRFEILPDPTKIPCPVPQLVLSSENGIHLFLRKLN